MCYIPYEKYFFVPSGTFCRYVQGEHTGSNGERVMFLGKVRYTEKDMYYDVTDRRPELDHDLKYLPAYPGNPELSAYIVRYDGKEWAFAVGNTVRTKDEFPGIGTIPRITDCKRSNPGNVEVIWYPECWVQVPKKF